VSKIESGAGSETGSRQNVQRFFKQLVPAPDRQQLAASFVDVDGRSVGLGRGVSALYDLRCAIVHDGEYWDFRFPTRHSAQLISQVSGVHTTATRLELRRIVILGAMNAAQHALNDSGARTTANHR
jgi:hypothetical protein